MDYEKTISFSGNAEKAIDVVTNTFIQHSFEIVSKSSTAIELMRDAMPRGSNVNPLAMISRVCVEIKDGCVSVGAEYGGVRKNSKVFDLFYFRDGDFIFSDIWNIIS